MNALREQVLVIQGRLPTPMLGLLTHPGLETQAITSAVIIVNGGAQYRAGAHRLFVQMARLLARQGHAVLRFDLPGQGDSPGLPIGFEDTAAHIGAAIDTLHHRHKQLQVTGLLGLCDGASACLLYLHAHPDPRVTHLALLNPWVRNEVSAARAQLKHYYLKRMSMPQFWRKLLEGKVGWSAVAELFKKLLSSRRKSGSTSGNSFQVKMLGGWESHNGPITLVLSGADLVAQEFQELVRTDQRWRHCLENRNVKLVEIRSADHTFSWTGSEKDGPQLDATLANWIKRSM